MKSLLVGCLVALATCLVQAEESKQTAELRKKAEAGDTHAQRELATAYLNGEVDGKSNSAEAMIWWHKAAELGHAKSQSILGARYLYGFDGPKDTSRAVEFLRKAAVQGWDIAQRYLGNIYFYGNGVPRDYIEAAEWYRLAADQGDATAQSNLGLMYSNCTRLT